MCEREIEGLGFPSLVSLELIYILKREKEFQSHPIIQERMRFMFHMAPTSIGMILNVLFSISAVCNIDSAKCRKLGLNYCAPYNL
jgi:hypothetical protein